MLFCSMKVIAAPCDSITTITCGTPITFGTVSGLGDPSYPTTIVCGGTISQGGLEKIYKFIAPASGTYILRLLSVSNSNAVGYGYKTATTCNSSGWNCLGILNAVGDNSTVNLNAGDSIFILANARTINATSQTFKIDCLLAPPIADFSVNSSTICTGQTVTYTDLSTNSPTSWNWVFASGTPSVSSVQNPNITYNTAGTFNATLTVMNASGSNTIVKTSYVLVNASPTLTLATTNSLICDGQSAVLSVNGASTYSWSTGATTTTLLVLPAVTTVYTVTGTSSNGCVKTAAITQSVNAIPSVSITNSTPLCAGNTITLTAIGASTYLWNTSVITNSIIDTPTGNVSYTVTGTNGAGCSATAVKNLTINTLPIVTAASTATSICEGQSSVLSSSGASNYSWSTGAGTSSTTIFPTISSSYSVIGTDMNGCKGVSTVSVSVNTSPTLTLASTNGLICNGQSTVLSVTGANSYSWSTGVTTSTLSVSPTITTVYTVTGTGSNGCTKTSAITQSVSVCTGIEATQEDASYNISPNPFSGELNIEVEKSTLLTIVTVLGQVIYSVNISAGHHTISTTSLSAGVYYIELVSDEKVVRKMIKE